MRNARQAASTGLPLFTVAPATATATAEVSVPVSGRYVPKHKHTRPLFLRFSGGGLCPPLEPTFFLKGSPAAAKLRLKGRPLTSGAAGGRKPGTYIRFRLVTHSWSDVGSGSDGVRGAGVLARTLCRLCLL
jgi:hypothetical protein